MRKDSSTFRDVYPTIVGELGKGGRQREVAENTLA